MNRRSFFGSLFAAFAIKPFITAEIKPAVEPVPQEQKWIPNPDWVNAPYEIVFYSIDPSGMAHLQASGDRYDNTLNPVCPIIYK